MRTPVRRFARNTVGRDIIVGDIHGHFAKLRVALDEIGFHGALDRLFCVGDLVDRGPDSDQVVQWLDRPWLHSVKGNHEEFCIGTLAGWISPVLHADPRNGGSWFLRASDATRANAVNAFAKLPIAIELDSPLGVVGIVHAECPTHTWSELTDGLQSDSADEAQYLEQACLWSRSRIELAASTQKAYPVKGVAAVVCGHTYVREPTWLANSLFIDTGAWRGGAFTLIDAATLKPATPIARN